MVGLIPPTGLVLAEVRDHLREVAEFVAAETPTATGTIRRCREIQGLFEAWSEQDPRTASVADSLSESMVMATEIIVQAALGAQSALLSTEPEALQQQGEEGLSEEQIALIVSETLDVANINIHRALDHIQRARTHQVFSHEEVERHASVANLVLGMICGSLLHTQEAKVYSADTEARWADVSYNDTHLRITVEIR